MNKSNFKTQFLSLLLVLVLTITMMPMNVFATESTEEPVASNELEEVASGDCGENGNNVHWVLDATGILTITGSGAMTDYSQSCYVPTTPWYKYRKSIKKIVVEDGVTTIGAFAFYQLSYVTSINISDDVLSFKAYAFASCNKIQEIRMPNNLQYIANYCFEDCKALKKITIPECVTKLGDHVFNRCTSLKDVQLPSNMSILPQGFFSECGSLEVITLPNSITEFAPYCFDDCTSLKEITFPTELTTIGDYSFHGCTSLENIEIPETLTSIAEGAFCGCSGLIKITIPKGVKRIPDYMCDGCTNLEQIKIPETVVGIGSNAFYNCSNLKKVIFHERLETVGAYAFYKCNSLKNIFLPNDNTSFGRYSLGFYKDIYDEVAVVPNFKLYVFAESSGMKYAEKNGVPYSAIDINIPTEQCVYTGDEIMPSINITIDEKNLKQGEDFSVEYKNNINIGTAIAKISFINDYANIGEFYEYYRIGNLLSECDIVLEEKEYQYHMSVPEVNIKTGDYTLVYGTDYEAYYTLKGKTWKKQNAQTPLYLWDLGECVIKIVGLNQYIGEEKLTVEVKKFDLANSELWTEIPAYAAGGYVSYPFDMRNFEYDGIEKKQSGYRVCDNKSTISTDNYEVSYQDNINPGTATMLITGKGNYYTGTLAKEFKIYHNHSYKTVTTKATVSSNGLSQQVCSSCGDVKSTRTIYKISSVNISTSAYTYDGKIKSPSVIVKDSNGNKLIKGKDYTVNYGSSSRRAIGRYSIKVTFKGVYDGNKTLYYTIGPKNPSSVSAQLYGYDDIKVSWKKVSGVTGYMVYYKKSTDSSWSSKTIKGTSLKLANLADGVKYNIKVVSYKIKNGHKCYNAGKATNIYTLKTVNGVKIAKDGSKVKVSWMNISGETGYQISQSTKKSGTDIIATYKTTSGNSKIVSAIKGKSYYYKVRAYKVVDDKVIFGPWSTVIKFVVK